MQYQNSVFDILIFKKQANNIIEINSGDNGKGFKNNGMSQKNEEINSNIQTPQMALELYF